MPDSKYSYFETPEGLALLRESLLRNFSVAELRLIGQQHHRFAAVFSTLPDLLPIELIVARLLEAARTMDLLDILVEWVARRDPAVAGIISPRAQFRPEPDFNLEMAPPEPGPRSGRDDPTREMPAEPPAPPEPSPYVMEPQVPKEAALPPVVRLRVDAAVPQQVALGQAFDLAVAVRQLSSPVLSETDLPQVRTGDVKVAWPETDACINLRVRVSTAECKIEGESSYAFQLYRDQDSPVFYFQLTPQRPGRISIIITVYQEENWLGAARVATLVQEQVVGELQLKVESQEIAGDQADQAHLRRLVEQHMRNLAILEEQKAQYGLRVPLDLINEIEHERRALAEVRARLEAL